MSATGIFYVFLYVSDLERSKAFYRDKLGWQPGTDEQDVAGFSFGEGYLVIHRDTRPERVYGGGMWIAVKVDDVNAEHAALIARGVEAGELLDQPWGERQFYFKDPDGYNWSYGQSTRA
jgi:catechol 2,3-dioxygenase-like lactoylglutathione lyase family enzyme